MRLVYVDESYCKTCYYVTALLVPDIEVRSLAAALDDVVDRAVAAFPELGTTAELHGYDIFQGRRDWAPLQTKHRARIGVYDQALRAIADHDVVVIIRGVMSARLRQRYGSRAWHPHTVTLWHLLERCDEYLERATDVGLVIADEPGQADQQPAFRADLREFQSLGTWGYRSRVIKRIVDTIHFAPSSASRLVQAVDLIAFLYHRMQTTRAGADPRAIRANNLLWHRIQPRIAHCYCWHP